MEVTKRLDKRQMACGFVIGQWKMLCMKQLEPLEMGKDVNWLA
jgi:hypothetical protein